MDYTCGQLRHNMQVTSNVERSATVRGDSFWIKVLIFDEVLDNVQISMLACKMEKSEA